MKKCVVVLFTLAGLFLLSSCSSKSPEQVSIDAVQSMIDGKYDKLLDAVAIPEKYTTDSEIKGFREEMTKMFMEIKEEKYIYDEIAENGGVKKIVAVKDEDGKTVRYENDEKTEAIVRLELICKNGDTLNVGNNYLVKQDKKWKLKID